MSEHIKQSLLDLIPKGDGYNSAYADTLTDAVEYIGCLETLYNRVNEMMAPLGAYGQICATDDRVIAVLDALHDIDGGVYRPISGEDEAPELFPGTLDALRDLGKQKAPPSPDNLKGDV